MNIAILLLTLATILFITANDKNIRASKYVTFMFLLVVLLHQVNIKSNNIIVVLLAFLFIFDEILSYIPKLDKLNRMRKIMYGEAKLVEFSAVKKIPLNTQFNHAEHTKAIKIAQGEDYCMFVFTSYEKGDKQGFFCRDFFSIHRIIEGDILLHTKTIYGNITTTKYLTGETISLSPYQCTAFESLTEKVIIESKAYV